MAKTSSKARQAKRERLVAKYAALRKELKKKRRHTPASALPGIAVRRACTTGAS